jgi:hypothetical protein
MKKFGLLSFGLLAMFAVLSNHAEAQIKRPGILLGGNLMYSAPKGDFASNYKGGVGGEVIGGIGLGKTYLVGTLGYSRFLSKANARDITYKPMKIGVRQFILGRQIFINADIGNARIKDKTENTTENHFTRGFGGGVKLAGIEAALYYDGWKNANSSTFSNSLQFKLGWNITI